MRTKISSIQHVQHGLGDNFVLRQTQCSFTGLDIQEDHFQNTLKDVLLLEHGSAKLWTIMKGPIKEMTSVFIAVLCGCVCVFKGGGQ